MAEAVGLAASIAGLVGIAGQILKGALFIREFVEDVSSIRFRLRIDMLFRQLYIYRHNSIANIVTI